MEEEHASILVFAEDFVRVVPESDYTARRRSPRQPNAPLARTLNGAVRAELLGLVEGADHADRRQQRHLFYSACCNIIKHVPGDARFIYPTAVAACCMDNK